MFLRCRNSPAPCGRGGLARGSAPGPRQPLRRVASLPGGRLEHTPPPSGRGKLRVSPPRPFLPRAWRGRVFRRRSATVRERGAVPPLPRPCRTSVACDGKVRLSGSLTNPGRGSTGHASFKLADNGGGGPGGVCLLAGLREAKRRAGGGACHV